MDEFNERLKEYLKDPEFAAYFANAREESERELLECGIIKSSNPVMASLKSRLMTQSVLEIATARRSFRKESEGL